MRWRPDARFLQRALMALTFLLLSWALSSLLATLLGWRSNEPALSLAAPPTEDGASGRRALLRWFEQAQEAAPVSPLASLQLIAVIAGHNGVALIGGIEASPVAVQAGKEARPGLRLVEVQADRAIFEQAGVRNELSFPPGATATVGNLLSPAPAAPPAVVPVKPAAKPSPATSVSRGRLASIAQSGNLGAWDKGLAAFPDGGIRITAAAEQPLAQILNLRDGDIIRQINEREIGQLADISLVYHYFSQTQDVDLQILRDGKPVHLQYKIQP
ncbi:hypothetical protein C0V76_06275 [Uliginosibacterium sp. TH139]|nr:hypothetical protein C0V76_06275 [Uliginosibacterium sp. TH139]